MKTFNEIFDCYPVIKEEWEVAWAEKIEADKKLREEAKQKREEKKEQLLTAGAIVFLFVAFMILTGLA